MVLSNYSCTCLASEAVPLLTSVLLLRVMLTEAEKI
jgi:hypothetical protein